MGDAIRCKRNCDAKIARVVVPGIPHHLTHRGNRSQRDEDLAIVSPYTTPFPLGFAMIGLRGNQPGAVNLVIGKIINKIHIGNTHSYLGQCLGS